jgi:hypothetical protein
VTAVDAGWVVDGDAEVLGCRAVVEVVLRPGSF